MEAIGRISNVDIGIVCLYYVCILLIGLSARRKVKDSSGFLVGNRMFGWFATLCTQGASMKGSAAFVGYGGGASKSGVGVLFGSQCYNMGGFLAILLGFVRKLRKACNVFNIRSMGDVFFFRYKNSPIKLMAGSLGLWLVIATLASQLSAVGVLFNIFSGGKIPFHYGILIAVGISMIYTSLGGLVAVIHNDVFQWLIMTPVVFIILPITFYLLGATPTSIHAALPETFFHLRPSIWWLGLLISGMLTSAVDLTFLTRYISSKTSKTANRGSLLGYLYTTLWAGFIVYLGLAAAYMLGVGNEIQQERVFFVVAARFFPVGLIGIFVAAILATTISTIDSYLHVGVQASLVDILKPFLKKEDEKRDMLICRVLTIVIALFAVLVVLKMKFILTIFYLGWTVYSSAMFVPFLSCLFLKKASDKAIILSMLCGFIGSLVVHQMGLKLEVIWGVGLSTIGLVVGMLLGGNIGVLLPGFDDPRTKEENLHFIGTIFTLVGGLSASVGVARLFVFGVPYLITGIILIIIGITLAERSFVAEDEVTS